MMHNPIIERLLYLVVFLGFNFRFGFNSHGVVPDLIALRFDLSALSDNHLKLVIAQPVDDA